MFAESDSSVLNQRDHQMRQNAGSNMSTPVAVLQEIAQKCNTKVDCHVIAIQSSMPMCQCIMILRFLNFGLSVGVQIIIKHNKRTAICCRGIIHILCTSIICTPEVHILCG